MRRPVPAAVRALRLADELAEDAPGDVLDPASATAAGAADDRRAGSCPVAVARRADGGPFERHLDLDALRGVGQRDLDLCCDVATAGCASASPAAEDVVAEERAEQVAERAEVEARRPEPTGTKTGVAVAIVELASLGIGERLVGLGDLAEAHLGVRHVGDVRMELARELAEGLLDRLLVRVAGNSEELVVIALCRRHGAHIVPVRVALTGSGLDYSSP